MDPSSRKKIYILAGIIGVIVIIIVWIVMRGKSSSSNSVQPQTTTETDNSSQVSNTPIRKSSDDGSFPPPAVFPLSKTLDLQVLNSTGFQTLKPYDTIKTNPSDFGRDNPFNRY